MPLRSALRRGRAILVLLLFTTPPIGVRDLTAAQDSPDKNSVELVVRGCLKGREVTADEISGNPDLETESDVIFRLSARGEVNNDMKRHNGRLIVVTGLVKKTALATPGFKIGGGRIVIGAGPMSTDPTRNPTRNPPRRLIPMDASSIELVAEACPTVKR